LETMAKGKSMTRPTPSADGGRLPDHVVADDPGPAVVGQGQRGQDAQGGGLAGAVGILQELLWGEGWTDG
jgi:hypothetical protein